MASKTPSGSRRFEWMTAAAVSAAAAVMSSGPVRAADPCDAFTWNIAHERAVFATPPVSVTAATTAGLAPTLELDKLYDITLTLQDKVNFMLQPAKKALADGAFAGMVTLHIPRAGKYRVSMSEGFWLDVIAEGKFAPTDDFTGAHDCRAPRKIVQYPLPAGNLVLQFSNTNTATVRVTVTAVPQ